MTVEFGKSRWNSSDSGSDGPYTRQVDLFAWDAVFAGKTEKYRNLRSTPSAYLLEARDRDFRQELPFVLSFGKRANGFCYFGQSAVRSRLF